MASVFWEKVESQSSLTNDQRYTYNNSTWASQLNQIPPYAKITDVTVFLRYRSTVSGGKWEFGIGDTKFADGSTESSSKETTVSVLSKVTTEGANSGEINGNMIFRFHGAFRVYHLGHITVTWYYNNPVFVVSLSAGTGGTVSGAGTYEVGTNATITATPASGYKFVKWDDGNTNASRTVTVASGSQTAFSTPLSYTAIFEKEKVSCTVTYNGNGATGGSVASQSGNVGESLTLANNGFEKIYKVSFNRNDEIGYLGYKESKATFQGWYTAASGGTKVGDGGASYTPTGNTTLYAHWSAMPAVTLDTPERDGYTFLGWYTAAEGSAKVGDGGGSYTPSGNITLYAHWEEKPPEITSAAITYGGAQVSKNNKIPTGEGFLIAVGIK